MNYGRSSLLLALALAIVSASVDTAIAEQRVAPAIRVAPPGRCVAIPSVTWRVERTATQSSPPDPSFPPSVNSAVTMATARTVDLDRDGALDVLVPEPSPTDCNNAYTFAIYLTRGACGHRVGTIRGMLQLERVARAVRPNGLPELVTTIERTLQNDPRVPAQRQTETITYRYDGSAYREHSRAVTQAVCHHCAHVECRNTRIQPPSTSAARSPRP